jgi:hypothetical protein
MTIHGIRIPTPTPISREETLRRIEKQIEAVWIKMMAAAEEKYPGILEMVLHLERSHATQQVEIRQWECERSRREISDC